MTVNATFGSPNAIPLEVEGNWSVTAVSNKTPVSDEELKSFASIYASAMGAIRFLSNASKTFFDVPPDRYLFGEFKLVAIIPVALAVESLAKTIFSLGQDCARSVKVCKDEAIDFVLSIINDLGTIGDYISTFAEGLAAARIVALEAVKWSTPLLIASLPLEAIGMMYNAKAAIDNLIFTKNFKKEAGLDKKLEEYTLEDYEKGLAQIENGRGNDRNFVGKHFMTDDQKLIERLRTIASEAAMNWASTEPEKKAEAQKLMYSTMRTLKDRLITTRLSHALNVVATSVGILGVCLLFTPGAPAGYAILGVSALWSIARTVERMIESRKFREALNI